MISTFKRDDIFRDVYTLGHILQSFWAILLPAILKGGDGDVEFGTRWLLQLKLIGTI